MRTHIRNMKRHHKANADYSQKFFKSYGCERGTLRAGYIWAIIKASLFLLLYSFLTFMCGWLYKYYDLWILPWLTAWLLIIIPKSFFLYLLFKYFFLLPHKNICDIMRVSYDIMNVSSGHFRCKVSRVAEKNSFCNLRQWCFWISSRG